MTEPAKLGTENFILSRLYGREMHVDRQAGYRVLLEAHRRYKEAVDDVVSAQNHFDFAVHRHHHRSRDDVVFGCGVLHIETQRRFAAGRGILKLRFCCAKLAVGPGITEVPGELHPRYFHLHGIRFRGAETLRSPDGATREVHPHKEDSGQHGPDNFQTGVAVRIRHFGSGTAIAITPNEVSQGNLSGNEDHAHEDKGRREVMIDAGGCGGGSDWQPPCLRHEKIGAREGDQPDDNEKNEAHAARPPVGFSAFPTVALFEFSAIEEVENANRGEYNTGFSERKRVLASILFSRRSFFSENALNHFWTTPQRRIDEFFCFE